jgi:hypothetical protein
VTPLERLAHRGPGDTEYFGEAPLARHGVAGLQIAPEHLADQLVEDIFGHRLAVDRLQGHTARLPRQGQTSSGQTS